MVERSVEDSLDEPIGEAHAERGADVGAVCSNPLREEPHPALVATVRRFGMAGLVAGALGSALLRWWRNLSG